MQVCKDKGHLAACLLDTKGPEIRTAMLRDGKDIELEANQLVTIHAVGDEYTKWEGYKDPATGETHIGLSYAKLCSSVKPGNKILLADGSISIAVEKIVDGTSLVGRVLNSKKLGQRKNCNLPGVKVEIPVLTDKDIDDLQNFCVKHKMDFVAASFVQSQQDVLFIRRVLDEAGGQDVSPFGKHSFGKHFYGLDSSTCCYLSDAAHKPYPTHLGASNANMWSRRATACANRSRSSPRSRTRRACATSTRSWRSRTA